MDKGKLGGGTWNLRDGTEKCEEIARLKKEMVKREEKPVMRVASRYDMACYGCGTTEGLQMIAHRDNANQMVGWLFVCPEHVDNVVGMRLVPEAALEQARAAERERATRIVRENCPACDDGKTGWEDADGRAVECQYCRELIRAIREADECSE